MGMTRNPTCAAGWLIDFDTITCDLPLGHDGDHHCEGEDGDINWSYA